MKKFFVLLALAASCLQMAEAQCKYKGVPRQLRRYCVSDYKPKPEVSTKLRVFFEKLEFSGQAGFAKDAQHYYLYLHLVRNLSKSFDLRKSDALVLKTASGKRIEVFPAADFSGRRVLTTFAIGCYYVLTEAQLQALASEKVEGFRLYAYGESGIGVEASKDPDSNGWHKDEKGNAYFNHTIEADMKKEKFRKSADCLLNKK